MSLRDKAKNQAQSAKGKAKEKAGKVKNDESLEAEGAAEKVVGDLKQAGEKVEDAFRK